MNKGPISPHEVIKHSSTFIPQFVFLAFNELIKKNFNATSKSSLITEKDVVKLIIKYALEDESKTVLTEDNIYANTSYLRVEGAYREKEWTVDHYITNNRDENYYIFGIRNK